MASVDVTVRGAGVFGLSIAWACVLRGARVQVVDPHGVGAGSSGGVVGALAPHVPENWNPKKAFQLDSLLMAETFWNGVSEAGGRSAGYGRLGRLQPVMDAAGLELARSRAEGAARLWRDEAVWEVVSAAEFGGFCPPSPTGWVIHDTLSARMHPKQACLALEAALAANGVPVVPEAEDAGAVVWATGWQGLTALSEALQRKVGDGVKGQSLTFAYAAPEAPQLFIDGMHFVPHADGTVAVGSTSERDFEVPDAVDALCADLEARARSVLPVLADVPVQSRWAGVRPRARSRAPLLDAWPGRPGHFIANGGFKIGFGMAPKVAEVMTDVVLEGNVTGIPDGFRLAAC